MSHDRPTVSELTDRVRQSAASSGGVVPRDVALVWDEYFAALIEWGLISIEDHARLVELLPANPESPVIGVFLGWNREELRNAAGPLPESRE